MVRTNSPPPDSVPNPTYAQVLSTSPYPASDANLHAYRPPSSAPGRPQPADRPSGSESPTMSHMRELSRAPYAAPSTSQSTIDPETPPIDAQPARAPEEPARADSLEESDENDLSFFSSILSGLQSRDRRRRPGRLPTRTRSLRHSANTHPLRVVIVPPKQSHNRHDDLFLLYCDSADSKPHDPPPLAKYFQYKQDSRHPVDADKATHSATTSTSDGPFALAPGAPEDAKTNTSPLGNEDQSSSPNQAGNHQTTGDRQASDDDQHNDNDDAAEGGCGALVCARGAATYVLYRDGCTPSLGTTSRTPAKDVFTFCSDLPPLASVGQRLDSHPKRHHHHYRAGSCQCKTIELGCKHCGNILGVQCLEPCSTCISIYGDNSFVFRSDRVSAVRRVRGKKIYQNLSQIPDFKPLSLFEAVEDDEPAEGNDTESQDHAEDVRQVTRDEGNSPTIAARHPRHMRGVIERPAGVTERSIKIGSSFKRWLPPRAVDDFESDLIGHPFDWLRGLDKNISLSDGSETCSTSAESNADGAPFSITENASPYSWFRHRPRSCESPGVDEDNDEFVESMEPLGDDAENGYGAIWSDYLPPVMRTHEIHNRESLTGSTAGSTPLRRSNAIRVPLNPAAQVHHQPPQHSTDPLNEVSAAPAAGSTSSATASFSSALPANTTETTSVASSSTTPGRRRRRSSPQLESGRDDDGSERPAWARSTSGNTAEATTAHPTLHNPSSPSVRRVRRRFEVLSPRSSPRRTAGNETLDRSSERDCDGVEAGELIDRLGWVNQAAGEGHNAPTNNRWKTEHIVGR